MKISVVLAALCLLFAGALAQKCIGDTDPKAPADWKKDGEIVNPLCEYWDSRSETCNTGCFFKPQPTPTVTATGSPIPECDVKSKCVNDFTVLSCGTACGPFWVTEGFIPRFCITTSWAEAWYENCKDSTSYSFATEKCESVVGDAKDAAAFVEAINGTAYAVLDNSDCFNGATSATLSALAALVVLAVALF